MNIRAAPFFLIPIAACRGASASCSQKVSHSLLGKIEPQAISLGFVARVKPKPLAKVHHPPANSWGCHLFAIAIPPSDIVLADGDVLALSVFCIALPD